MLIVYIVGLTLKIRFSLSRGLISNDNSEEVDRLVDHGGSVIFTNVKTIEQRKRASAKESVSKEFKDFVENDHVVEVQYISSGKRKYYVVIGGQKDILPTRDVFCDLKLVNNDVRFNITPIVSNRLVKCNVANGDYCCNEECCYDFTVNERELRLGPIIVISLVASISLLCVMIGCIKCIHKAYVANKNLTESVENPYEFRQTETFQPRSFEWDSYDEHDVDGKVISGDYSDTGDEEEEIDVQQLQHIARNNPSPLRRSCSHSSRKSQLSYYDLLL